MLEQGHQLRRGEIAFDRAEHEVEEGAGQRARHRHAGRIVDGEVVALEPRRHPPRQHPVRRDQRRGLARRLDAGSEDQRDGLGLVMRGRRESGGCRQVRWRSARARPAASSPAARKLCQRSVLSAGRSASLTRLSRARARRWARCPARTATSSRRRAELVQQLSHAGLRVLRMSGKARPACLVERAVEAGQHHRAVRQRGDDLEQPRRGRHRAGRARRDHRMGEPLAPGARPRSASAHSAARPARRVRCQRDRPANAR